MQGARREDRTSERSFVKKSRKQVARWDNRALMRSFARKAATVTAAPGACHSNCRPPVEKTTCRESRLFKQAACSTSHAWRISHVREVVHRKKAAKLKVGHCASRFEREIRAEKVARGEISAWGKSPGGETAHGERKSLAKQVAGGVQVRNGDNRTYKDRHSDSSS